jgi:hypothetical protein
MQAFQMKVLQVEFANRLDAIYKMRGIIILHFENEDSRLLVQGGYETTHKK